jgi:hypothetical protein
MGTGRALLFVFAVSLTAPACSNDGGTFDPGAVGDDVVIKINGIVLAELDQSPIADASVWVDVDTSEGGDPRATTRSNEEGRFSMVFTERDCSLATEFAFRVFARKKGYQDGEFTREGNGGVPVLKCVTREQTIGFQLSAQ